MIKTKHKSRKNKKKALIAVLAIVLLAVCIVFVLEKTGQTSLFSRSEPETSQKDSVAKTTSTAPTAQEDYKGGDERQPGNSLNENRGTSVIRDTEGNLPPETNTSQPITSSTGEISVYAPAKNSPIKKGQLIAGASTLPQITYRVIDDISGMIAMGELSVVNGKFSGNIDFNTGAENGRIDIFATRSDGSEYSTVEIPIVFR